MTPEDLKTYFKTGYRFKQETGMSDASFTNWQKQGFIPEASQCKIERITKGKLKAVYLDSEPQRKYIISFRLKNEKYINYRVRSIKEDALKLHFEFKAMDGLVVFDVEAVDYIKPPLALNDAVNVKRTNNHFMKDIKKGR